jgi:hypothetical protein
MKRTDEILSVVLGISYGLFVVCVLTIMVAALIWWGQK